MSKVIVKTNWLDLVLERLRTAQFCLDGLVFANLIYEKEDTFRLSFDNRYYNIKCLDGVGLEFDVYDERNEKQIVLANPNKEKSFGFNAIASFFECKEFNIEIKFDGKRSSYCVNGKKIGVTDKKFLDFFKSTIRRVSVFDEAYLETLLVAISIEVIQEYYCKLYQGID
ncbi:hypothetical protein [Wenyingzhuangia sp. IMCC45574]